MAVPKHRTTRSKRGMRRSHDYLSAPTTSTDPFSGELHVRHQVTANGYYRGKPVARLLAAMEKKEAKANKESSEE